ncbi:ankyrin repeat domain-containing protein 42-like isoform X1 [Clytia hemisphaerica]|uniref:Uncharacterized protein n=2 Tax=Clytia hemisphaerica TaxID=252671 RepID=A0A7M5WMP8_9CNID
MGNGKRAICKSTKDAIQQSYVIELQRLIHQGAEDIDVCDQKFKFTPLHWAAHFGSLECMHWLLWHGANINARSKDGWSAAHIAAIRGRSKCMQALAANGADLNLVDSREKTPTHLASSHGNSQTLQEILRKGINIEARDNMGWTAAHTAAYHGRTACFQLLVKWGCDITSLDPNGNSLAHLAASEGHVLCLKLIIATCKNINAIIKARNDMGEKPIDCAIQYYKKECVDYLKVIEYDVDNPETAEDLSYPAHTSAFKGDLAYLQMIVETGVASINERDDRNSTPLHKAAGCGQIEVVKWLIDKGADTSLLNRAGETVKDVALRFGKLACAKLLGHDVEDVFEMEDESTESETFRKEFIDNDAKLRAGRKLKELTDQLEIAKLNFTQLGGVLDDDLQRAKINKEHSKIVREFESQLEYERLKREKLEQQLDEMRLHIHQLHRKLEDERSKVDELIISTKEKHTLNNAKKKNRPRTAHPPSSTTHKTQPGVFLVQKPTKKSPVPRDQKPPSMAPRPPKSGRAKSASVSSRSRRTNSLESDASIGQYFKKSTNSRPNSSFNGSLKSRRQSSSDSNQSDSGSHSDDKNNNGSRHSERSSLKSSSSKQSGQKHSKKEKKNSRPQDEQSSSDEKDKSIFNKITSVFKKSDSSSSSDSD